MVIGYLGGQDSTILSARDYPLCLAWKMFPKAILIINLLYCPGLFSQHGWIYWPFLYPEAALLLVSTKNHDLWPDPIFWVCAGNSFRILSQSDSSDLMESLWITDFWCWTNPEVAIPGADQKESSLWGWEWILAIEFFFGEFTDLDSILVHKLTKISSHLDFILAWSITLYIQCIIQDV